MLMKLVVFLLITLKYMRGDRNGGTPKRPPKMLYHVVSFQSPKGLFKEFFILSFFPVKGWGTLQNIHSVRSPGPFLNSTLSKTLVHAPPHPALSASWALVSSALTCISKNFVISFSLGSVPEVCMAFV